VHRLFWIRISHGHGLVGSGADSNENPAIGVICRTSRFTVAFCMALLQQMGMTNTPGTFDLVFARVVVRTPDRGAWQGFACFLFLNQACGWCGVGGKTPLATRLGVGRRYHLRSELLDKQDRAIFGQSDVFPLLYLRPPVLYCLRHFCVL